MNTSQKFKILFLCTGNSARSILAEYLIRRLGGGRFESFSAGSKPRGQVHPMSVRVLKENYQVDASDASSKGIEAVKDVPFDFVITVCDHAKESCPVWPGQPIIAHWGTADPAAIEGSEEEVHQAFVQAALHLHRRIDLFCCLPFDKLDRLRLAEATRAIGDEGAKAKASKD